MPELCDLGLVQLGSTLIWCNSNANKANQEFWGPVIPHDPDTMALLSSAGHWLVGAFVLPVAVLIGFEANGRLTTSPLRYCVPALIILSGFALAGYIVFHAGLDRAPEMLQYALGSDKQIQHFVMAAAVVIIGASEWLARTAPRNTSPWRFVWPTAYMATGLGFIFHVQTGPQAEAVWHYHALLGIVILSASLARLGQVSKLVAWRPSGLIFAGLLAIEAGMLLAFRAL